MVLLEGQWRARVRGGQAKSGTGFERQESILGRDARANGGDELEQDGGTGG